MTFLIFQVADLFYWDSTDNSKIETRKRREDKPGTKTTSVEKKKPGQEFLEIRANTGFAADAKSKQSRQFKESLKTKWQSDNKTLPALQQREDDGDFIEVFELVKLEEEKEEEEEDGGERDDHYRGGDGGGCPHHLSSGEKDVLIKVVPGSEWKSVEIFATWFKSLLETPVWMSLKWWWQQR